MNSNDFSTKLAGFENEVGLILMSTNADIPDWAKSLLFLFQGLLSELTNVNKVYELIDWLESTNAVNKNIVDKLVTDNIILKDELSTLRDSVDLQEQRSRNYNLVLHGVPEATNENPDARAISILNSELQSNLEVKDLQNCHRLGRKDDKRTTGASQPRPRPIIFKFKNYTDRILVFKNKRKLKGKPFVITENITAQRYKLYMDASNILGRNNVWTAEGRIFGMINNSKKLITSLTDVTASA